jgi:hypothetical protein
VGVEVEVEKKRRRPSSQEITALIEEYRQSGQTRREFCQSHGCVASLPFGTPVELEVSKCFSTIAENSKEDLWQQDSQ